MEYTPEDVYFHRLHILVARNGLTWLADIRHRNAWTKELARVGETAALSEYPEEYGITRSVQWMLSKGWAANDIAMKIDNMQGSAHEN